MKPEEYYTRPELSFSQLKHILRSPAHFRSAMASDKEPTLDMTLGTIVHAYVLEGKTPGEIAVPPKTYPAPKTHASVKAGEIKEGDPLPWNGNASYCKNWKSEQIAAGKTVITSEGDERQCRMVDSLQCDDTAQSILGLLNQREVSLFGNIEGVDVRGRLDCLGYVEDVGWSCGDLKKTPDASPREWGRVVVQRHYAMQAWFYMELVRQNFLNMGDGAFTWIVVEDSDACPVQCYEATPAVMEYGRRKAIEAITLYKKCSETGIWPAYGGGIMPVELPTWAFNN